MQRDNWGKWAMGIALVLIIVAGTYMVLSISKRTTPVTFGKQTVYAKVANTDETRRTGLSGSDPLKENEAMLFVFETPGRWGMWMREMKYSLDIIWLDSNKNIIYVAENVSPDTYPKVFLPDKEALYVIELPAGFVQRHGLQTGQVAGFTAH